MSAPVSIFELAHNWRKWRSEGAVCASAPVRQSPIGDGATGAAHSTAVHGPRQFIFSDWRSN
jgi:hypothetical protein